EIDLVEVEKLGIDARHQRRIALIVVLDELHRPAEQAALGVDLVLQYLQPELHHLAGAGVRAGERHAAADADRVGGGSRRDYRGCTNACGTLEQLAAADGSDRGCHVSLPRCPARMTERQVLFQANRDRPSADRGSASTGAAVADL